MAQIAQRTFMISTKYSRASKIFEEKKETRRNKTKTKNIISFTCDSNGSAVFDVIALVSAVLIEFGFPLFRRDNILNTCEPQKNGVNAIAFPWIATIICSKWKWAIKIVELAYSMRKNCVVLTILEFRLVTRVRTQARKSANLFEW